MTWWKTLALYGLAYMALAVVLVCWPMLWKDGER